MNILNSIKTWWNERISWLRDQLNDASYKCIH